MVNEGIHPLDAYASASTGRVPSPWARNYWCPYIRTEEHLRRAIKYVEGNPIKAGKRPQAWKCVVPYAPIHWFQAPLLRTSSRRFINLQRRRFATRLVLPMAA